MSSPETALAPQERTPVALGSRGMELNSLDELFRFARYVVASPFAPKGFDSPEAVVVAIAFGREVGLLPLQALQNLAVINGRPSVWGDAALALVRASGLLEYIEETYEGDGDNRKAVCLVKRVGARKERREEFTVAMAKRAGLWGKSGPWQTSPERMLRFRARGFALRDEFGDVLKGLVFVEEAEDYDIVANGGHRAEPRVVEMPASRTESLKRRLAAAKPEAAAALELQAPAELLEPETEAIDADEALPAEATADVITAEQAMLLENTSKESGIDLGPILDELDALTVQLIPAECFDVVADWLQEQVKAKAAEAPTTEPVAALRDAIDELGMSRKAILTTFKVKTLEELTEAQIADAWVIVRNYQKK